MARRAKRNYVNNRDFYDAIVAWKQQVREAEEKGEEYQRFRNTLENA